MIHSKFPAKTWWVKEDKKKLYICTDFLKITNLIFQISDRQANLLAAIIVNKICGCLNAESTVLSTFFLFFLSSAKDQNIFLFHPLCLSHLHPFPLSFFFFFIIHFLFFAISFFLLLFSFLLCFFLSLSFYLFLPLTHFSLLLFNSLFFLSFFLDIMYFLFH